MAKIRFLGSNDGALVLGREADTNVQTVGRSLTNYLDQGGIEVGTLLQIEENELVADAETTILFAMLPMATVGPSGSLALDAAVKSHTALLAFVQAGKISFLGRFAAVVALRPADQCIVWNSRKGPIKMRNLIKECCRGKCRRTFIEGK